MAGARKLDLTKSTMVQAHTNGLWPVVTDVARWPEWLRDAKGREGLARVEALPYEPGKVNPQAPEVGRLYRFTFTNGLTATFKLTYWVAPAQISLGMVPDTRENARGVEGLIFDLDLFPQRDGTTQFWFGATVLLEKGFQQSLLARWPKRDLTAWVEGFHRRIAAQAPELTGGATTKREVEALRGAGGAR